MPSRERPRKQLSVQFLHSLWILLQMNLHEVQKDCATACCGQDRLKTYMSGLDSPTCHNMGWMIPNCHTSGHSSFSAIYSYTKKCVLKITLLRVIPTMTFIHFLTGKTSGILSDISSDILFGILSGISSGICSGISSDILSGISSDILSDISSDILAGISSDIQSGISSDILSDILSGILSGILSDILSDIFSDIWKSRLRSGREHWNGCSQLRSGREHWAWMLAVEVRQGTLGVDGRG